MIEIKRKMHKRIAKEEKGITIITLVVTIVVMIILTSVTIKTITGENGIIGKTKGAVENHKIAEENEKKALEELEKQLVNVGEGTEDRNEVGSGETSGETKMN